MADDTAALVVAMSAKLTDFQNGMQAAVSSATQAVGNIESAFANANPDASGMIARFRDAAAGPAASAGSAIGLIIAGGIAAAAVGVASKLGDTIEALANLGDRADDLRLPVNLLQALSVAAGQARVPVNTLNEALDQFTKVSKKDEEGAQTFYKALSNIGQGFVTAFKDAPTQTERLRILSDALKSTTDEVKRAQLAQTAFGSDNERLIGLFDQGRAALDGYVENVRRLGLEVNETFVAKAQEAKSQLSLFSRVLTDEFSSGVADLIPLLVSVLPYIERLGAVVRDTLGAFAANDAAKPVGTLKAELETLNTELQTTIEKRDRLASQKPSAADNVRDSIRGFLDKNFGTDLTETEADLDAHIEKIRQRMGIIKDILQGKENTTKPLSSSAEKPAFQPRASLKDTGTDADSFDKATEAILRHIAALTADANAIGLTAATHEQLRAELRLLEAARQSDVDITDAQIEKYGALRATMGAQQALQQSGINLTAEQAEKFLRLSTSVGAVTETLNRNKTAFQGINDAIRFGGNQIVDIIDRATQKGANFGQIMSDVLRNLSRQLLQAALTGEGAFAKLFGTASTNGGAGGLLGAIFGGLFKAGSGGGDGVLPGGIPLGQGGIGRNAGGTDDWHGGLTSINESGPEIVNLPSGTQIIPNDVVRRMGNSGGNHTFAISIDLNGANGDATIRKIAGDASAKAVKIALQQVGAANAQQWRHA